MALTVLKTNEGARAFYAKIGYEKTDHSYRCALRDLAEENLALDFSIGVVVVIGQA